MEWLIVASLLSRNIKSRLLLRDPEKATTLFGKQDEGKLQVRKGDTRNPEDLDPSIFEGVTHVICCTGTTAFPSKRWDADNTPERVGKDYTSSGVCKIANFKLDTFTFSLCSSFIDKGKCVY